MQFTQAWLPAKTRPSRGQQGSEHGGGCSRSGKKIWLEDDEERKSHINLGPASDSKVKIWDLLVQQTLTISAKTMFQFWPVCLPCVSMGNDFLFLISCKKYFLLWPFSLLIAGAAGWWSPSLKACSRSLSHHLQPLICCSLTNQQLLVLIEDTVD